MTAAADGYFTMVKLLRAYGADLDAVHPKLNKTALQLFILGHKAKEKDTNK